MAWLLCQVGSMRGNVTARGDEKGPGTDRGQHGLFPLSFHGEKREVWTLSYVWRTSGQPLPQLQAAGKPSEAESLRFHIFHIPDLGTK